MSEWRALDVRGCGSGSKPKICESKFKVALFWTGQIKKKNGGRTERAWYLTWKTAEPCLGMLMVTQNAAVGRLSSRFETHLKSILLQK